MADGGFADPKVCRQITNTHFIVLQGEKNLEPSGIGNGFIELRELLKLGGRQLPCPCLIDPWLMDYSAIT
jgi:hypothetical protein